MPTSPVVNYKYLLLPHDANHIRRSLERKFITPVPHQVDLVVSLYISALALSIYQSSTALDASHSYIDKPYEAQARYPFGTTSY